MKNLVWAILVADLLLAASAQASDTRAADAAGGTAGIAGGRLGRYDFSYTAEPRLRPAQVFDDGRDTYFQFPSGAAVPAIFVQTAHGPVLAEHSPDAHRIRIKGLHAEFLLRLGQLKSRVLYAGGVRQNAAIPQPATPTPPAAPQIPENPPAVIAPLPLAPTQLPQPSLSAIASAAARWGVQVADVTLANTLARWGAQAGYRVRWDAARHVLIDAPDVFTGTFEEAVEAVLSSAGIRGSSYPLSVCFHPNTPPLARITRLGQASGDCQ
ncbi:MAG: TcpQ domain-containing protein [Burkholderiaceae bacterium]|nr:TcpQ domain-containing protein [Burkholderiaceae bacterium]